MQANGAYRPTWLISINLLKIRWEIPQKIVERSIVKSQDLVTCLYRQTNQPDIVVVYKNQKSTQNI